MCTGSEVLVKCRLLPACQRTSPSMAMASATIAVQPAPIHIQGHGMSRSTPPAVYCGDEQADRQQATLRSGEKRDGRNRPSQLDQQHHQSAQHKYAQIEKWGIFRRLQCCSRWCRHSRHAASSFTYGNHIRLDCYPMGRPDCRLWPISSIEMR